MEINRFDAKGHLTKEALLEKDLIDDHNIIMLRNEIKFLQKKKNNLILRIHEKENELLKLYEKKEKV